MSMVWAILSNVEFPVGQWWGDGGGGQGVFLGVGVWDFPTGNVDF